MPPYVARKRSREASPADIQPPPAKRAAKTPPSKKKNPTLFDAADENPKLGRSLSDNKRFLQQLNGSDEEEEEVSDVDSDDFEDAMPAPRNGTDDEEDNEEEMDWEGALETSGLSEQAEPAVSGDLELTLNRFPTHTIQSLTAEGAKKGPSKIERSIRNLTHSLHVQCLLAHNLTRNHWVNDKQVQQAVLRHLTPGLMKELNRWKEAVGKTSQPSEATKETPSAKTHVYKKGKGKAKVMSSAKTKNQRDWGNKADHIEPDTSSASRLDPTLRLLKILVPFWKKRFQITAPGLRKQGYKDLVRLEQEMNSFRKDPHSNNKHGERVQDIAGFRKLAEKCQGSRDVGAQLFTALLRGIGMEVRMVANLQPIGFGWSKAEEAAPPKQSTKTTETLDLSDSEDEEEDATATPAKKRQKKAPSTKPTPSSSKGKTKSCGDKNAPIALSDSESALSSAPHSDSSPASDNDTDSDASLIDLTPAIPTTFPRRHDKDLLFPHYWSEILLPNNTYLPVDSLVLSLAATNPEKLALFEPRGAKADKAKQVLAYTVAFSADNSAKDVTVRYLKKHAWPGKTKGFRQPIEKIQSLNRRGKVIRTTEVDFFANAIRPYLRPQIRVTRADKAEDATDLQPVTIIRGPKSGGEETLQGYKSSAEFVLERHLRREEALLPTAKPVRHFTTGKGDKEKSEPVYLRADVVACKTIESWHKEGRAVKADQVQKAMKMVPVRAVTLMRKREIEEAERETGEKMRQPLYSRAQTEWIIPPPITNGIIPKNAFGNMDVYVSTMVPKGAVHVRLKGTAKICKKLGIDFAEACTGFEFGNKRAVPVLTGVVVAKENEGVLRDAWRADEEEKRKKERVKREKVALGAWKKFLVGLRIVERVRREYGGGEGVEREIERAVREKGKGKGRGGMKGTVKDKGKGKSGATKHEAIDLDEDDHHHDHGHDHYHDEGEEANFLNHDDIGGGFLLEGEDMEEIDHVAREGGFVLDHNPGSRGVDRDGDVNMDADSYHTRPSQLVDGEPEEEGQDGKDISGGFEPGGFEVESEREDELANGTKNDEDEDDEKNTIPAIKPTARTKATPAKKTPASSKAKPQRKPRVSSTTAGSAKHTPARRGKSAKTVDGEDDDDAEDVDVDVESISTPKPTATPASVRRRNAGRKSKEGARSGYFVEGSDLEDE